MMWHRSPEFIQLFQRVEAGLKALFETSGDVMIIAGSGTAGMESAVANLLSPGEECLVLSGGKFGERWVEIVQAFGAEPVVLNYPYGSAVDPGAVADMLDRHPDARVVFATQNESSTAVLNDIEAIARVAKERERLLVVDAVSSLGGTPLPMDAWGVDVVVTGSQKCLMTPPGLAFVAVSEAAWEKAKSAQASRYYLDWALYRKAARTSESPFTSAVSLMYQVDEALNLLAQEGAEARFARHRLMRAMVREAMAALGFPLFVADEAASPTLTAARGGAVDAEALRKAVLAKTGVIISGGQGELKGEIFRIGHMGAATPLDMVTTVAAVEMGLAEVGGPVKFGVGVRRAMEVWQTWR